MSTNKIYLEVGRSILLAFGRILVCLRQLNEVSLHDGRSSIRLNNGNTLNLAKSNMSGW